MGVSYPRRYSEQLVGATPRPPHALLRKRNASEGITKASKMPYIPPEIILMVLSTPNIDFPSLLQCARVNKGWRMFIFVSNTLRAKLFLPPHTASGKMAVVTDPRCMAIPSCIIVADVDLDEEHISTAVSAE
jgi:hypothetical protein